MSGNGEIDTRRLSFVHYYTLGIVAILFVTGITDLQDVAFLVFSIIYAVSLDKVAFRASKVPISLLSVFGDRTLVVQLYAVFAAIIGLFLPLLYILEGVIKGHNTRVSSAVPHLFLLCSQIFMEGVTFTWNFSLPTQLFVPIFYNSRRLFTIVNWLFVVFGSMKDQKSVWRLSVGQGLATANMILWTLNLFGLLLPFVMPRVFKIYYANEAKPM